MTKKNIDYIINYIILYSVIFPTNISVESLPEAMKLYCSNNFDSICSRNDDLKKEETPFEYSLCFLKLYNLLCFMTLAAGEGQR